MPPAQPLSPQDAFARHGFPEGYPLWNPSPVLLPPGRRSEGLRIGDVGIIDRDGCFDALFNICKPRDHILERANGFPTGFTPIERPMVIDYSRFSPGKIFSSPETSWHSESRDAPFFTGPGILHNNHTVTRYTAELSDDGAHVIAPQGAKYSKVAIQVHSTFESQANDHRSKWLTFARTCRNLPSLSSLYLITGFCRTKSWASASFNKNDDEQVGVSCELVMRDGKLQVDASSWNPQGRFAHGMGPDDQLEHQQTGTYWPFSRDMSLRDNQAVFIQSFTITARGALRLSHLEQLASCELLNAETKTTDSERTSGSERAGAAQPQSGFTTPEPSSDENSTSIKHTPTTTSPAHPSEIINRYLLTKRPAAQAAVTHDSVWMTMLAKLSKLDDLESTIDAIVPEDSIVTRNGVVHLASNALGLKRFGVALDQSDFPIDLTDFIRQDDDVPYARRPFGNIFKGSLHTTHESVIKTAITIIKTGSPGSSSSREKEMIFQRFAEAFAALDHTNVLPLMWAAINPGKFVLVSPWAIGGMLTSYLESYYDGLTNGKTLALIRDVAIGLHYLHSEDILHGCLSGSTVVIGADGTALLSDFGLSSLEDERGSPLFGQSNLEREIVRWTAPESLAGDNGQGTGGLPTEGSDIYSFGCIMLQILSGKVPYHYYERDEDVLSAIIKSETPRRPAARRLTDHRWWLIQACWLPLGISATRPSSKHVLEFVLQELGLGFSESRRNIGIHVFESAMDVHDAPAMPEAIGVSTQNREILMSNTAAAPEVISHSIWPESYSTAFGSPIVEEQARQAEGKDFERAGRSHRERDEDTKISQIAELAQQIHVEEQASPVEEELYVARPLKETDKSDAATRNYPPIYNQAPLLTATDGSNNPFRLDVTSHQTSSAPPPDLTSHLVRVESQSIATGGFSDIYRCHYHGGSVLVEVAVKVFRFGFTMEECGRNGYTRMLRRELGIWKRLEHGNIVPFLGIAYGFGLRGAVSLVSLWMPNGSLHKFISQHDDKLGVAHRLQFLLDISEGVRYLHSCSIVHGDLNSNNVLLDAEYTARLTDFGCASLIGDIPAALDYLQMTTPQLGVLRWMAPELIDPEEAFSGTTKSDIYSFGCVALQVLSGKPPWSEVRTDIDIMLRLAKGQKPARPLSRPIDDSHWDLIEQCLSSAEERPIAEAIIPTIKQFLIHCPSSPFLGNLFVSAPKEMDYCPPTHPRP